MRRHGIGGRLSSNKIAKNFGKNNRPAAGSDIQLKFPLRRTVLLLLFFSPPVVRGLGGAKRWAKSTPVAADPGLLPADPTDEFL